MSEKLCYTEFAEKIGISRAGFYKLMKEGKAPVNPQTPSRLSNPGSTQVSGAFPAHSTVRPVAPVLSCPC